MILAVVGGYVALTRLSAPDDAEPLVEAANGDIGEAVATAAGPGGAAPETTAAAGAAPVEDGPIPFPNVVVAGAVVGADGVARIETPFEVPPGPDPSPEFQAEIDAWAAAIRETVPVVDGLTTLDSVDVEGRLVVFNYRINIDLRDYTLPQDKPELLIPGLDGWLCDGNTCFEIKPEMAALVCRSAIRPLLDGGAVGVYKYRDVNGLPIATAAVTAADCVA